MNPMDAKIIAREVRTVFKEGMTKRYPDHPVLMFPGWNVPKTLPDVPALVC
ncbi:MAG: hypothetical protein R6U04_12945 [Bacteroidales bacterium]